MSKLKNGDVAYFAGIDRVHRPTCDVASYRPLVGVAVFRIDRITPSSYGECECTLLNLDECLTVCGLAIGKIWHLHASELAKHDNLFSMPEA